MSRHIVDHRAAPEAGKLKRFVELERLSGDEGSHRAVQELARRAAGAGAASRRMAEFLRIDRGWRA